MFRMQVKLNTITLLSTFLSKTLFLSCLVFGWSFSFVLQGFLTKTYSGKWDQVMNFEAESLSEKPQSSSSYLPFLLALIHSQRRLDRLITDANNIRHLFFNFLSNITQLSLLHCLGPIQIKPTLILSTSYVLCPLESSNRISQLIKHGDLVHKWDPIWPNQNRQSILLSSNNWKKIPSWFTRL